MANEYTGASFGTILPAGGRNFVDNMQQLREQQLQDLREQQRYRKQLAERDDKQQDALTRYAQQLSDNLAKKVDLKNPFNALLSAGVYDLKKKVVTLLREGKATDAEVVDLINSGGNEIMDLNSRWNSINATIDQSSQALKDLGIDPKQAAAKARELAFYSSDPDNPKRLILDVEKLKNADAGYDPVQDVYMNHLDELPPIQLFKNPKWTRTAPADKDVYDPQTGDLMATRVFMNYVPGLHRPTLKDNKPYIGIVGEVPIVDTDEYGNETPMMHEVTEKDPKTGLTVKKKVPLMGINDEGYTQMLAANPLIEPYLNQQLAAVNRHHREQGIPELKDEKAAAFKRVALYDAIPKPLQPQVSSHNLSDRQDLQTAAAKEKAAFNSKIHQQTQHANDEEYKIRYRAATQKAFADYQKANSELSMLKAKNFMTQARKDRIAELEKIVDAGTDVLIDKYMGSDGTSATPATPSHSDTTPAPSKPGDKQKASYITKTISGKDF